MLKPVSMLQCAAACCIVWRRFAVSFSISLSLFIFYTHTLGLDVQTSRIFLATDNVEPHPSKQKWWTNEKRDETLEKDAFFKKDGQTPKELELRIGAQVVLMYVYALNVFQGEIVPTVSEKEGPCEIYVYLSNLKLE